MHIIKFKDQPYFPSSLWISPVGRRLTEVAAAFERPDGPATLVRDIKSWVLDAPSEARLLDFDGDPARVRKVHHETVLKLFFEELTLQTDLINTTRPLWVLLPAIEDKKTRREYRRQLTRSIQTAVHKDAKINFLFEPEMTLEYFRLIRDEISLEAETNNLFLIIDCGALTCNMTIAISNRNQTFTRGTTGRDRGGLRAVSGQSAINAGRYVDNVLWQEACSALKLHGPEQRDHIAERVKIQVAKTRKPQTVKTPTGETWTLSLKRLKNISKELWKDYGPLLDGLLEKTLRQLQNSKTHHESLRERNIQDTRSLAKAFRAVLLAGGSSQLPGFANEVRSHLKLPDSVPVYRVGAEFPVAASIGAMAHVLDRQNRLHSENPDDPDSETPDFHNSLQDDVFLVLRTKAEKSTPLPIQLISRDEWPEGYEANSEIPLPKSDKDQEYAIVWGPDGAEKGDFVSGSRSRRWQPLKTTTKPRKVRVRIHDGGDTLTLTFIPKAHRHSPRYNLNLARTESNAAPTHHDAPGLLVEASNDIVIDFGMSKTVVVTADHDTSVDPRDFKVDHHLPRLPGGWTLEDYEPTKISTDGLRQPSKKTSDEQQVGSTATQTSVTPKAGSSPKNAIRTALKTGDATPVESEEQFINESLRYASEIGFDISEADFVFLHLAAKVRPLILLAGPSGAGKSSLAQFYADVLGCSLCKVPVQAHWTDDSPILGEEGYAQKYLKQLKDQKTMGVVLFDEVNLTRPEYYLSRWVQAIEDPDFSPPKLPSSAGCLHLVTIGTMNIDEWSRPPPDKLLDRAFLLELRGCKSPKYSRILRRPSPHLVTRESWSGWCQPIESASYELPKELSSIFEELRLHCDKHGHSVHESLQPSRRALRDACELYAFWERHEAQKWLSREELLDRIFGSRILPKFRGSVSSMSDILSSLKKSCIEHNWDNSRRHLEVMSRQLETGFASFWG